MRIAISTKSGRGSTVLIARRQGDLMSNGKNCRFHLQCAYFSDSVGALSGNLK